MNTPHPLSGPDFRRIEKAISLMHGHYSRGIGSSEISAALNLSEYHFRRLFRRWAGIPPERFIRYLSKEHALKLIRDSRPCLEAALDAGFSGPGRLVETSVRFEAMTPGEIRSRGAGLIIRWGCGPTPFGEALIARTERGIVELRFIDRPLEQILKEIMTDLDGAEFIEEKSQAGDLLADIFLSDADTRRQLLVRGTNFQVKVWEALLRLTPGTAASYGDVARSIGRPGAGRAVGSAVAANRIAWIIPCHRVIRATGETGEYRWGIFRKQAILGWESIRRD